jgi:Bacterial conjugation TrbI-like protein
MDMQPNDQQQPNTEPSLHHLADMMDLDLNDDDPVNSHQSSEDLEQEEDYEDQVIDVESIEDDEFFNEEFNPEKNRTRVGLQNSGAAKGALVVGTTLALLGGGALIFQGQLPKEQVAQVNKAKDPADEKVESAQSAATKAQQSESETKAELALSKQKDSLAQANSTANQNGANNQATTDKDKTAVKTVGAANPNQTTPVKVAAAPPVAVVPKSNRASNVVAPQNAVQPVSIASSQIAPRTINSGQNAATPKLPSSSQLKQATLPLAQGAAVAVNRAPQSVATAPPSIPARSRGVSEAASNRPTSAPEEAPRAKPAARPTAEESIQRLRPVPAPGVQVDTNDDNNSIITNNGDSAPPPPLEPSRNSNVTGATSVATLTNAPSLTQYLQQAAGDTVPSAPAPIPVVPNTSPQQPVILAEANTKSKPALHIVPAPGMDQAITVVSSTSNSDVKQSLSNMIPGGTNVSVAKTVEHYSPTDAIVGNSTRSAFANGRVLLAGLPPTNNLAISNTQQPASATKMVTKEQTVNKNNPLINNQNPTEGGNLLLAASLLVGTSAKGSTVTPVLWSGDGNSSAKFVLKLDEPMFANNNREALPAGTQLVVAAKPTNINVGIADLEVVSVVIKGREYSTPLGAIVIRDDQGGLLVGEDYFRRDEQIAGRDTVTILTNAAGNIGQVLNRPTSTYSSTGVGGVSTNVVTNPTPNIFGAALEGGLRDLPSILSQRNQQAVAELANKPRVYQIPRGRSVRVFINQSVNF